VYREGDLRWAQVLRKLGGGVLKEGTMTPDSNPMVCRLLGGVCEGFLAAKAVA
jgi:hypothetical protein